MNEKPENEFEKAAEGKEASLVEEVLAMLRQSRKWWLIPVLVLLALAGLLIALGSSGAAPFIYRLF